MQQAQSYEDDQGNVYVRDGNRWRVERGTRPTVAAGPQAAIPGLVQMETPAQRAQADERAYDRQRDVVRDDRADRTEARAAQAAERAAAADLRAAAAAERSAGTLTDKQGDSLQYGTMMRGAEADYQRARANGYDPTDLQNTAATLLDAVPFDRGFIPALIRDNQSDSGYQAERRWAAANLRQMSGAAFGEKEVTDIANVNFDRANDQLADQRYRTRRDTYGATRMAVGSAKNQLPEEYPSAVSGSVGPTDPATGLPTYPGISATAAGITDATGPTNFGGPQGPGSGPDSPIDLGSLGPEDLLKLQAGQYVRRSDGTVYALPSSPFAAPAQEGDVREGNALVRSAAERGWTPESAVAQRENLNPILRGVDAFGRGFADMASLEFADEIAGGADALFGQGVGNTVGDRYRNNVEVQRAVDAADGRDMGGARLAGEVAGGVAGAFIAGPAALRGVGSRIASPLVRGALTIGRNALGGAAVAGTAAAGNARGDALNRAQAALKAAPVGAAVGAFAPALASTIAAPVVRGGQSAARFLGRQIGRVGEAAGVPNAAALTERATLNPLQAAINQFPGRAGMRTNSALADRAAEYRSAGIDPTLVDVLDDSGRGVVRAAATRATPARQSARDFAEGRVVGLQDRTATQARRLISNDPRNPIQLEKDLTNIRRDRANEAMAPLEGQLVTLDRDSIEALRSDIAAPAIREAAKNSLASSDEAVRNSGADLNRLADQLLDNPSGVTMTVRQAQDVSKAMLDAADGLYSTNPSRARALKDLGRSVRDNARTPERGGFADYGEFLDNYSADSGQINAVELGEQFMNMEADAFSDAVSRLSPEEQTIARASARRAIERASGTQGNAAGAATRLSSGREQRMRNQALLGDDAAEFQRSMMMERRAMDNGVSVNPLSGSRTNINAQDSAALAGEAAQAVRNVATGNVPGLAVQAARRFQSRGFSDTQAQALVEAAIDPARTDDLIRMLSERMSRREARSLARAVHRNLTSATGSGSVQ